MVAIHYTRQSAAARAGSVSRLLTRAAFASLDAPAIRHLQPWRWRIAEDHAELWADRGRPSQAGDPQGHLLAACGAALHHAHVALAAEGVGVDVARLPDPYDPDLLAVLRVTGPSRPPPQTERLRRAIAVRRSDQRPFAAAAVPPAQLILLGAAAYEAGGELSMITFGGAQYGVVTATADRPDAWLAAGEASSAVLLTATALGLVASSLDDLASVPAPLLPAGAGLPAAAIRLGVAGRLGASPHRAKLPTVVHAGLQAGLQESS